MPDVMVTTCRFRGAWGEELADREVIFLLSHQRGRYKVGSSHHFIKYGRSMDCFAQVVTSQTKPFQVKIYRDNSARLVVGWGSFSVCKITDVFIELHLDRRRDAAPARAIDVLHS
eukprot:COSAG03_NODE_2196_length_3017_cov_9.821796_3_plen_115_part_00